jgi:PAS domain S-box-containing protein
MPLATFLPAIRQIDNADAMVESMVEAVAAWAKVSRVGLFTAARGSDRFRLRAGIHCLPDTWEAEVASESALVRWMQARAHVISRSMLAHVAEAGQRLVLKQALDGLGAEVIIPLHGRRGLIGWIFVGHRVTGIPFAVTDLEDLVLLVENVSCTLENALLYEEVAVQKTLAETVLGSVPVGIVAVSADGVVRWYNAAAEGLLSMPASEVLNRPASRLSSRLADLLTRCVRGEGIADCSEWTEISTRRTVSVSVRRLESRGQRLGAVALIHDLTAERAAREQREETERMAFWSQLAALMAHQVYNKIEPMSALVQLLPERHQDPEFRDSFARVAAQEIENLKRMIKEIEDFATPTRAKPAPLELAAVVAQAVDTAQGDFPKHPVRIETTADDGPHRVLGDAAALTRCFVHVISNSLENLRNVADPRIQIVVFRNGEKNGGVVGVRMQDNGTGISPDLLADIWKAKPLNTTTPSRIGLGLPIVKRTVTEHKGEVNLETSPQGTTVTVRLPALSENGGGEA